MCRLILLAIAVVVVFLGGFTPPAHATPICATASTTGTVTGDRQVGPACVPYPFAVLCHTESAGIDPAAVITVTACVPV